MEFQRWRSQVKVVFLDLTLEHIVCMQSQFGSKPWQRRYRSRQSLNPAIPSIMSLWMSTYLPEQGIPMGPISIHASLDKKFTNLLDEQTSFLGPPHRHGPVRSIMRWWQISHSILQLCCTSLLMTGPIKTWTCWSTYCTPRRLKCMDLKYSSTNQLSADNRGEI